MKGLLGAVAIVAAALTLRVDSPLAAPSTDKARGREAFECLGDRIGGEVFSTPDASSLSNFDVVVSSDHCGNYGAVLCADDGETGARIELPVKNGLVLDLNASLGVELEDENRVAAWRNQVAGNGADVFVKRDEGRKVAGSGRPTFRRDVAGIGGHDSLIFEEQELVNMDEDAFDHLVTGSGYTWISVMCAYEQRVGKKHVNAFFGNLRNGPPYEGFWGNFFDDNRVWMGTRNGLGKAGLWHEKFNPLVATENPIEDKRYYLIAGRMGAGKGEVDVELFVNSAKPVDRKRVPVNPKANPSKMAIGQERDATNHPGKESFHGEIARFLVFDRPLDDEELAKTLDYLDRHYRIRVKGWR